MNDRISDTDRHRAVEALGVHFTQGRLDMDEYESRSESAMGSVTSAQLETLFMDLPLPHYNRGLAVRRESSYSPVTPDEGWVVKELDPWDTPIGQSPLTLRKVRKIGWVLAFAWLLFGSRLADAILPAALAPIVVVTPVVFMIIASIALAPNRPRYRFHRGDGSRSYPY